MPPPKGTALPSTPPPRGDGTTDDLTVEGTIGYPGLTCVLMRTADGKPYALTGPAVTSDVRTRARGGQQAAADPAGGSATRTRVRVTGHVDPNALSTCHAPVLVSSRIEVLGPAG
ncbi:hypothetical protein PZ938_03180 [Luteipulveratus sp. YIM 133132]|uniref:DUF5666 domain-containing protein n=1 Tax=Luteipulveratus flavus TaxID=3031728 RepID=A0ABT6CA09_9MICO|nr:MULTISPECIES: hypothetical protein [unclassified Luteipulveratus]MDE9364596.1 hypothetical protein [Luteipulveratus sp. YIM 133132]MDF8265743.1 hypothetical protein [Luteipulveratus sp. YIM 133296]